MNAEQFFNNGFGADVEKVHRKQVIDLMTNFAKHYHTEQCNIANVVGQSEQFYCTCSRAKGLDHDEEGMPYCIECQKPVQ
jgi:hypothetical protein